MANGCEICADCLSAVCAQHFDCLIHIVRKNIRHNNGRAAIAELFGKAEANSVCAAGHNGYFVLEYAVHFYFLSFFICEA